MTRPLGKVQIGLPAARSACLGNTQVPSLLGLDQDDYECQKTEALVRMDSKDVVQKAQQEMQHLKRHFLVAVNSLHAHLWLLLLTHIQPSSLQVLHDPDLKPMKDNDPVISTDLTDSRQTFLGQCQMCHWQFNTPRHAQYSTMMLLNHIHNKVVFVNPGNRSTCLTH